MRTWRLVVFQFAFNTLLAAAPALAEDPMVWMPPADGPKFVERLDDAAYTKQLAAAQPDLNRSLAAFKGYPKVGLRVDLVLPDGQGARSKIAVGDVLTAMDDKIIDGKSDLNLYRKAGEQVLSVFTPGLGIRKMIIQQGLIGVGSSRFKRDNPFDFDLDFDLEDKRWVKELGVVRYCYQKNPALAETAMFRAIRAGLPQSIGVNRIGGEFAFYQFHFAEAMAFYDAVLKLHPDDEYAARQFFFAAALSYKLEAALKCAREILSHFPSNMHKCEPDLQRMINAHHALSEEARLAPPPSEAMTSMLQDDVMMRFQTFPDSGYYKEDLEHSFNLLNTSRSTTFNINPSQWTRYAILPDARNVFATCQVRLRLFDNSGRGKPTICFQLCNYREEFGKDLDRQSPVYNAAGLSLNLNSQNRLEIFHFSEALDLGVRDVQVDLSDVSKFHALKIVALNGRMEMFVDGHRCFYGPTFLEPDKTHLCVFFLSSGLYSDVRNLTIKELLTDEEWKTKVVPDINKTYHFGRTRLHVAARLNDLKTATRLLEDGADASIKDAEGMTALDYAVASRFKALVDVMLSKNVPKTLFSEVALGEPAAVVEMLRFPKNYPPKNAPLSPLHVAVLYRRLDMLKVLLDSGFPINAQTARDREFATPLYWAAGRNYVEESEYLISRGADTEVRNIDGNNTIQVAEIMGHKDTSNLLRKRRDEYIAKQKAETLKSVKPPAPPADQF